MHPIRTNKAVWTLVALVLSAAGASACEEVSGLTGLQVGMPAGGGSADGSAAGDAGEAGVTGGDGGVVPDAGGG